MGLLTRIRDKETLNFKLQQASITLKNLMHILKENIIQIKPKKYNLGCAAQKRHETLPKRDSKFDKQRRKGKIEKKRIPIFENDCFLCH